MAPEVLVVVLLAAAFHAVWNALLKPIQERLEVLDLGGAILSLP